MAWRILLAVAAMGAALTGSQAWAAERTTYRIDVNLDVARGSYEASQRTLFTNPTSGPLRSLILNVTPAYFGAFTLRGARIDGVPVQASLDGVVLDVPLPAPLGPGSSTTLELNYVVDVPAGRSSRFGATRGIIALGAWYPVLYPLEGGRWKTHQYTPIGDAFFTEAADYDVTVRPNRPVTIASTGQVVSRDGQTRRIVATNVRDFAMSISERYATETVTVDGVVITAYFLPEHRAAAAEYLRTGAEVLPWLSARLGPYPWRTLDIAETWSDDPNQVGQEFPGLVLISSGATLAGGGMGSYLSYLVAHEVAHQWFYGIVGNDQIREPWLDESFATYLPERFYSERYPGIFQERWSRFRARLADDERRLGVRPIDSGLFDYAEEGSYFSIVYRRGAAFLDELRVQLGDAAFWGMVRSFVAQHSHGIATGRDFLTLAQNSAGRDLSALYGRYFARTQPGTIATGRLFPETGYSVVDEGSVRFFAEFRRFGGVDVVGYPASRPFDWDGFRVQVFQRVVFQWRPEVNQVYFVNVFDRLHDLGKDDWLLAVRQTPRHRGGMPESVLDAYPALRAAYDRIPLAMRGYPTSAVEDMGNHYAVRLQRVVLQQWKEDVPWAARGQVTVALGGDIAKEAGILPAG